MTLSEETIIAVAERLENAEHNKVTIPKITDDHPNMDWKDGYAIQYEIRRRKLERGTKIAGLKMGMTSRAMMNQLGVNSPIYGFLTDYGSYGDGAEVGISSFIHPRVEAEIAVVTKSPLQGPGCHIGAVLTAIDFVTTAIEIVDSRYENYKFDLPSVIADNTSAAGFVTGSQIQRPEDIDLANLGLVLEKNGEVVGLGAGAAVLGHPAASVATLVNMLAEHGEKIAPGTLILTGGITETIPVSRGDHIVLRCQELGYTSLRFV